MNDSIKLFLRKNIDRNEYEKLKVINDEKWLDKIIKYINRFYNECFFALGKIDDVIISSIYITKHPEQNDFYLISDLNILEEYKDKNFTNYIIESVLNILKDLNCIKVGAFVQNEFKDVYENIGFKKISDDYIFGNDKRSNSSYDPYYEIEIKQDYYCEQINEYTASIISKFITDKKYKRSQEVPNYFKPNSIMIKQSLLYSNTLDNEIVYAIMNGKIVFGYSKMYYDDNTLYLRIDMRENCLYNKRRWIFWKYLEKNFYLCIRKIK